MVTATVTVWSEIDHQRTKTSKDLRPLPDREVKASSIQGTKVSKVLDTNAEEDVVNEARVAVPLRTVCGQALARIVTCTDDVVAVVGEDEGGLSCVTEAKVTVKDKQIKMHRRWTSG